MLPNDEDTIFAREANPYPIEEKEQPPLVQRFPELMRANGSVDPQEAIVALLDRITELEQRIEEIGNH